MSSENSPAIAPSPPSAPFHASIGRLPQCIGLRSIVHALYELLCGCWYALRRNPKTAPSLSERVFTHILTNDPSGASAYVNTRLSQGDTKPRRNRAEYEDKLQQIESWCLKRGIQNIDAALFLPDRETNPTIEAVIGCHCPICQAELTQLIQNAKEAYQKLVPGNEHIARDNTATTPPVSPYPPLTARPLTEPNRGVSSPILVPSPPCCCASHRTAPTPSKKHVKTPPLIILDPCRTTTQPSLSSVSTVSTATSPPTMPTEWASQIPPLVTDPLESKTVQTHVQIACHVYDTHQQPESLSFYLYELCLWLSKQSIVKDDDIVCSQSIKLLTSLLVGTPDKLGFLARGNDLKQKGLYAYLSLLCAFNKNKPIWFVPPQSTYRDNLQQLAKLAAFDRLPSFQELRPTFESKGSETPALFPGFVDISEALQLHRQSQHTLSLSEASTPSTLVLPLAWIDRLLPLDPSYSLQQLSKHLKDTYALYQQAISTQTMPEGLSCYLNARFQEFADLVKRTPSPCPITPAELETHLSNLSYFLTRKGEALSLETCGNIGRQQQLSSYLHLLTAYQPGPWQVSEEDKKYLLQLACLASSRLPELVIGTTHSFGGACSTTRLPGLFQIASAIQQSSVGLEGLPQSVVAGSYCQAARKLVMNQPAIADNPENHALMEALYARGEPHLAHLLLPSLKAASPLDRPEGQQRLERALNALLLQKHEFYEEIEQHHLPPTQETLPADSLQLPERIFYLDLLVSSSHAPQAQYVQEIERFNQTLIQAPSVTKQLMGYARQVTLYTQRFLSTPSEVNFCTLLKYKIAYRSLKDGYFSGKKLPGFLKIAVSNAEDAMAHHASSYLQFLSEHPNLHHHIKAHDPSVGPYANKQGTEALVGDNSTPKRWLLHSHNQAVDILSGVVYRNGQKISVLPDTLAMHPYVRLLGINTLSYISTQADTFIHYSVDDTGAFSEQIRITQKDCTLATIYRNMRVGQEDKMLRYLLPCERAKLPRVLFDKGAREFWLDEKKGMRYGFTKEGSFVASIDQQGLITCHEPAPCHIPYDHEKKTIPLLGALASLVPSDTLMINQNQTKIEIPALELTFSRLTQEATEWHCDGAHLSGLVVDLSQPREGLLTLRLPQDRVRHTPPPVSGEVSHSETPTEPVSDKPIYLSVYATHADYHRQKAALSHQMDALIPYPRNTGEEKTRYLQQETDYRAAEAAFLDRSLFPLFFDSDTPPFFRGRDLASSAYLLLHHPPQEPLATTPWIRELAQQESILDSRARHLLTQAAEQRKTVQDELTLYLHLLLLQDAFHRLHEAQNSGATAGAIAPYNARYQELLKICSTVVPPPPHTLLPEVTALMAKYLPHLLSKTFHPVPLHSLDASSSIRSEVAASTTHSLLARSGANLNIRATKKGRESHPPALPKEIADMPTLRPDLMEGALYQEYGSFSEADFFQLFPEASSQNPLPKTILQNLVQDKILILEGSPPRFSLHTTKGLCFLTASQQERLRALLPAALPEPEKIAIATKIDRFLFQSAERGFHVSWTAPGDYERSVKGFLEDEKQRHVSGKKATKTALSEWLAQYNQRHPQDPLSIPDLTRIVLTGCHNKQITEDLSPARDALIHYLFHKTELQHIEAILHAPPTGARNQITLLSSRRQYELESLFEDNRDPERVEKQALAFSFLLLESRHKHRCSAQQFSLFRSLMLPSNHPDARGAVQAPMGIGKTTLAPLLAFMQLSREMRRAPEKRKLITYVVPSPLLETNQAQFHAVLAETLGVPVIKDLEFPRCFIDPQDRTASFTTILQDITAHYHYYDLVRQQGLVLIQRPETQRNIASQLAIFNHLAIAGSPPLTPEERTLCLKCAQALVTLQQVVHYFIFDECDVTLPSNSGDVNFTEGGRQPIEVDTILPIAKLVDTIRAQRNDLSTLPKAMLTALGKAHHPQYLSFLTDPTKDLSCLTGCDPRTKQELLLIRAFLIDPALRSFAYEKEPGTHFGVACYRKDGQEIYSNDPLSQSALLLAVPYEYALIPKGRAHYENPQVAAVATIRYYDDPATQLKRPHLDFLLTQIRAQRLPSQLEAVLEQEPRRELFLSELQRIAFLENETLRTQSTEHLFSEFFQQPSPSIRRFVAVSIVAVQGGTEPEKANSSRYVMGSLDDEYHGFSGTLDHTPAYFQGLVSDPSVEGKALNILCRRENRVVVLGSSERRAGETPTDVLLNALLHHANDKTRALIDAAGMFRDSPENVVKKLWQKLSNHPKFQGITGIVYFDESHHKRLYDGIGSRPCSQEMESRAAIQENYFAFFADKSSRGADVVLPQTAINAIVTVDATAQLNAVAQAVLRLRHIDARTPTGTPLQQLTFVLSEPLADRLGTNYKLTHERLASAHLAHYLLKKQIEDHERTAFFVFKKEVLVEYPKQAAACVGGQFLTSLNLDDPAHIEAYCQFLIQRNSYVPLVERPIHTLEEQYGTAITQCPRAAFIKGQITQCQQKLTQLYKLYEQRATPPDPSQAIYKQKFDRCFDRLTSESERLFCSRFHNEQVTNLLIDRTATSVAEGVSERINTAEASQEVLSTSLATADAEIDASLEYRPWVAMDTSALFTPNPHWFSYPENYSQRVCDVANRASPSEYERLDHLCYLMPQEARLSIRISPHLQQSPFLIPRFALVSQTPEHHPIFISQTEAECWIQKFGSTNPGSNGYVVHYFDSRIPETDPLLLKMQHALLQIQPPNVPEAPSLEALQGSFTDYVKTEDFVPRVTLTVTHDAEQPIDRYLEIAAWQSLATFGVLHATPQNGWFTSLTFSKSKIVVDNAGNSITLPLHDTVTPHRWSASPQQSQLCGVWKNARCWGPQQSITPFEYLTRSSPTENDALARGVTEMQRANTIFQEGSGICIPPGTLWNAIRVDKQEQWPSEDKPTTIFLKWEAQHPREVKDAVASYKRQQPAFSVRQRETLDTYTKLAATLDKHAEQLTIRANPLVFRVETRSQNR